MTRAHPLLFPALALSVGLSAAACHDESRATTSATADAAALSPATPVVTARTPVDKLGPVADASVAPHLALASDAAASMPFVPAPETAYSKAVRAAKPLAYYRFEETDAATVHSDVGGQTYDATVHGNVTHVPGALGANGGSAVHFSGSAGSIAVGKHFGMGDYERVFEFWMKAAPHGKVTHRIFTSGIGKDSLGTYWLGWEDGSDLVFRAWYAQGGFVDLSEPPDPPANTWVHFVVEMGRPETLTYTNGQQSSLQHGDIEFHDTPAATFFIGSDALEKRVFEGDIDEFAVYDHYLDDAVIAAHFAAGRR